MNQKTPAKAPFPVMLPQKGGFESNLQPVSIIVLNAATVQMSAGRLKAAIGSFLCPCMRAFFDVCIIV